MKILMFFLLSSFCFAQSDKVVYEKDSLTLVYDGPTSAEGIGYSLNVNQRYVGGGSLNSFGDFSHQLFRKDIGESGSIKMIFPRRTSLNRIIKFEFNGNQNDPNQPIPAPDDFSESTDLANNAAKDFMPRALQNLAMQEEKLKSYFDGIRAGSYGDISRREKELARDYATEVVDEAVEKRLANYNFERLAKNIANRRVYNSYESASTKGESSAPKISRSISLSQARGNISRSSNYDDYKKALKYKSFPIELEASYLSLFDLRFEDLGDIAGNKYENNLNSLKKVSPFLKKWKSENINVYTSLDRKNRENFDKVFKSQAKGILKIFKNNYIFVKNRSAFEYAKDAALKVNEITKLNKIARDHFDYNFEEILTPVYHEELNQVFPKFLSKRIKYYNSNPVLIMGTNSLYVAGDIYPGAKLSLVFNYGAIRNIGMKDFNSQVVSIKSSNPLAKVQSEVIFPSIDFLSASRQFKAKNVLSISPDLSPLNEEIFTFQVRYPGADSEFSKEVKRIFDFSSTLKAAVRGNFSKDALVNFYLNEFKQARKKKNNIYQDDIAYLAHSYGMEGSSLLGRTVKAYINESDSTLKVGYKEIILRFKDHPEFKSFFGETQYYFKSRSAYYTKKSLIKIFSYLE